MIRTLPAKDFPSKLCTYLRTFKAWKTQDEIRISDKLKNSLRQLLRAEVSLENEPTKLALVNELREQSTRLKSKLALIGGNKVHDVFVKELDELKEQERTKMLDRYMVQGQGQKGGMSNEQLAHELLLNPLFVMHDKDTSAGDDKLVYTKIRETFKPAFWKALCNDLGKNLVGRVLLVLKEVRTAILNVCGDKYPVEGNMIQVFYCFFLYCPPMTDYV